MSSICVARRCRNIGRHRFPKDEALRQKWEDALHVYNFKATEHHSLCSDHFQQEDYVIKGSSLTRVLKSDAVPSLYLIDTKKPVTTAKTNKRKCVREEVVLLDTQNDKAPEVILKQDPLEINVLTKQFDPLTSNKPTLVCDNAIKEEPPADNFKMDQLSKKTVVNSSLNKNTPNSDAASQKNFDTTHKLNDDVKSTRIYTGKNTAPTNTAKRKCFVKQEVDLREDIVNDHLLEIKESPKKCVPYNSSTIRLFCDAATQKNFSYFSINKFKDNETAVSYYTGFKNYGEFMYILSTISVDKYRKYSKSDILDMEDGFFLTIIKLKHNKPDLELAILFEINEESVFILIEVWLNCMYESWWNQHLPHMNLNYIKMINDVSRFEAKDVKQLNIKGVWDFIKDKKQLHKYSYKQKSKHQINTQESPIKIKGFKILHQLMDIKYLPLWSKMYFACCILYGFKEGKMLKQT